jgi:hypothetical protein
MGGLSTVELVSLVCIDVIVQGRKYAVHHDAIITVAHAGVGSNLFVSDHSDRCMLHLFGTLTG